MVERWKMDAVRALKRLVRAIEKLGTELERYNDLAEAQAREQGVLQEENDD